MAQAHTQGLGVDEVIGDKREAVLRLAEKYGITNVRVVGSVARGDASADSDVDLLMTIPPGWSAFDLVGLWLDMQDAVDHPVSIIPDSSDDVAFMHSVLEDAVPL